MIILLSLIIILYLLVASLFALEFMGLGPNQTYHYVLIAVASILWPIPLLLLAVLLLIVAQDQAKGDPK